LILLITSAEKSTCQTWKWSSKIGLSWVCDNNVLESLSDPCCDQSGRFLFQIAGKGWPFKPLTCAFQYKGGLSGYNSYKSENRLVHSFKGICEINIIRNLSFGTILQNRDKSFINNGHGYQLMKVSPYFRLIFPYGLRGKLIYSSNNFDYEKGSRFDFNYYFTGIQLSFSLLSNLVWNLQYTSGVNKYDRSANDYIEIDPYTGQWIEKHEAQKDRISETSVSLEIYYWAWIMAGYYFQKNVSNSYGYTYTRPKIVIMAGKALPWGLTLSLYWTMQIKRYSDSLKPFLQIQPDAVDEENNYILLDLSKNIGRHLSFKIQTAWYRNESPFRDLYYTKNLVSTGLTYQF
jgi:hypothetical protein